MIGRIDAFPEDRMVANWHFKQNSLSGKVKEAGIAVDKEKLYIAFSPKLATSKQYADLFAKGIIQLRQTGQLEKILNRYGLKDWK